MTLGLFSLAKSDSQIGVEFLPDGVAIAQVRSGKENSGQILRSEFIKADGDTAKLEGLKSWVRDHRLQKNPCVCVIGSDDCDVYQVERPEVEAAELLPAVTWKIKDLVNYDISQAVVDSYPMPVSSKNNQQQVGVVAAKASVVGEYVESIKSTSMNLVAIDIQELVRSNLDVVKRVTEPTIAVLSLAKKNGLLSVYSNGDLYVSREFKIGIDQLALVTSEDQSVFDSILLEIQRSLDYFESYYGMGSVAQLHMFPQVPVVEKMALYMQNLTNLELEFISAESADASIVLDPNCFHAYCAALRGVNR